MSNMGRTISIDPGGTTGYCLAYQAKDKVYVAPAQAELDHLGIHNLMVATEPDHVICENFEYRPGHKGVPYVVLVSLEYIGVIKLYCQGSGFDQPVYMQMAMHVVGNKNFFNDDRLKTLNLYKRGVPHGLDAMRHFLHWFWFKQGAQFRGDAVLDDVFQLVEEKWIRDNYF